MQKRLLAAAAGLALLAGCGDAGTRPVSSTLDNTTVETHAQRWQEAKPTLSAQDTSFANQAALAGQKEVQLGRLANEKAASPEVRDFGQKMVKDHSKANEELKDLAHERSYGLPPMGSKQANEHAALSSLSGAAFDRKYVAMMKKDHQQAIALFEKQALHGQDEDLREFAEEKLPTLRHHLEMLQDMK